MSVQGALVDWKKSENIFEYLYMKQYQFYLVTTSAMRRNCLALQLKVHHMYRK